MAGRGNEKPLTVAAPLAATVPRNLRRVRLVDREMAVSPADCCFHDHAAHVLGSYLQEPARRATTVHCDQDSPDTPSHPIVGLIALLDHFH